MERRVKANLQAVNEALEPYWDRLGAVAVESTYNWYWFVDGLRSQGRDVRLANPAKMEQYRGFKVCNDSSDAGWIAEQLRLGILPECYIYPPELRPMRDTLRRRMLIVRQRTQSLLSLESLLARHGWSWPGVSTLKEWTLEDIGKLKADPYTSIEIQSLLEVVRKLDRVARWVEDEVLKALKAKADDQRIKTMPGIGRILAMVIVLESGQFGRFASAGAYASYCRTVKSERLSNGKRKGQNHRKNGNRYLAWAFAEAAAYAMRFHPQIHSWYERKKRRSNAPKAMKALACKLAKATWHGMQGKEFEPSMLFG